jgi:DNA-binding response OmpR family regulator
MSDILVMTAAWAAAYKRQCAADACLGKPFDLDDLLAIVTRCLAQDERDGTAAGRRNATRASARPSHKRPFLRQAECDGWRRPS